MSPAMSSTSNVRMALGYELLTPSTDPDPLVREQQNQQRAELFCAILLRRRDMEGLAGAPLMEEWITAAILLYLHQKNRAGKRTSPAVLQYAFSPSTQEF